VLAAVVNPDVLQNEDRLKTSQRNPDFKQNFNALISFSLSAWHTLGVAVTVALIVLAVVVNPDVLRNKEPFERSQAEDIPTIRNINH
jgi:hypothetical protein